MLNDAGWDMQFSVKAGVVNYPGTLIGGNATTNHLAVVVPQVNERGSYVEPLLSYHFANDDRAALELDAADKETREQMAALGVVYTGPGSDGFMDSLKPTPNLTPAMTPVGKVKVDSETMDQFFKQGRYSRAALNPDGRQVLAVERRKGFSSQLVLVDLVTRSISDVAESADDEPFAGLQWLNDDTAIYFGAGTFSGQALTAIRWRRSADGISDPRVRRWEGEFWIAGPAGAAGSIKLGSAHDGAYDTDPCLFTAEPDTSADLLKLSHCDSIKDSDAPDSIRDQVGAAGGVDAAALRNSFPGQQAVLVGRSVDGRTSLVFVYDDKSAGVYYSIDTASGEAKPLGSGKTEIIAEAKAGSLAGPDGNSVSYHLTLPLVGDRPYPLVVVPDREESTMAEAHGFDSEVQFLARHGYAVLKVRYTEGGAKDAWSEQSVAAALQTVLHGQPLDAGRVCVYGVGVDGYVALMSAIHDPGVYKCVATLSAVTDIPVLYNVSNRYLGLSVRRSMEAVTGLPGMAVDPLRKVSPVYQADRIGAPVLVAAGENHKIDVEQAFRLKAALQKRGGKVEYLSYQAEDAPKAREAQEDFYMHLLDFLDRNIGSKH
jgi:hypothetical protein